MSTTDPNRPVVLVVAGSDSSGGAGFSADLVALQDEGAAVRIALTAVTAQTTGRVIRVDPVPLAGLRAQLQAAGAIDAAKLGMLVDADRVRCVTEWLDTIDPSIPIVLDPVIRSSSGGELLSEDGVSALWPLLDRIALITPNQDEATVLAAGAPWEEWAEAVPCPVLVTGGDAGGDEIVDLLFVEEEVVEYVHPRVAGRHRGTGCALSTRVAARLARGHALESAIGGAIEALTGQLTRSR